MGSTGAHEIGPSWRTLQAVAIRRSAWQEVWAADGARLVGLVDEARFLGRLHDRGGDCRNAIVNVMALLRAATTFIVCTCICMRVRTIRDRRSW
jgi:hypothetical protein